jgi:hypothetical protein
VVVVKIFDHYYGLIYGGLLSDFTDIYLLPYCSEAVFVVLWYGSGDVCRCNVIYRARASAFCYGLLRSVCSFFRCVRYAWQFSFVLGAWGYARRIN